MSAAMGASLAVVVFHGPCLEPASKAQEIAGPPAAAIREPAVPLPPVSAAPPAPLPAFDYTPDERVSIQVYDSANRSVVNITTNGLQGDRFLMIEVPSQGEGSGIVLDRQGHILTNFHVVDAARQIQVTLFDGTAYAARLVGQDPATDVAVIKIEAPAQSLFPVVLGSSSNLRVGQRVFAIGNPFGLERTLSTGIISSLNRSLPRRHSGGSIKSIIQIDAAINPGNSGGPLLDSHCRMIGMNTAIASKTGESAGVGFAIPINTISRVIPQLIATGKVRRPDVGIVRVYPTERGLLIATLTPGGPAEKAGLHGPRIVRQQKRIGPFVQDVQTVDLASADVVVGVDGKPVKTADDFIDAIESKQPGERVVLSVLRGGQVQKVPVQLAVEE
jgi:S1-C subfamily serine protease